jgi:alkanesulfonate monooxygenase SsuD/methylene tetrahydromethanopterin reductase-like flavin-dependent oxidoreductase (luciferase family)
MTTVPEAYRATWPLSVKTAQLADRAGFEAIVPYARWKGYSTDKLADPSGTVLDPYTWAAGLTQVTQYTALFVTSHAPTVHPILAAKQCATIDIMSGGRLGLNVVGGWNKPELEMFGAPIKEHDQRYDHLAEWIQIVEKLWTEYEEFDFDGRFFKVIGGSSLPKPIQKPYPPIMNAGGSDRGRRFACQYADMCFVIIKSEDPAKMRAEVDSYKRTAREEFGREVQVWSYGFVVQRDSQAEADKYLHHYSVECENKGVADGWMAMQGEQTQLMPPSALPAFRQRFVAGSGGFPLVGTPDRIAERLELLSSCGIDGMLLTWVDFVEGLDSFNAHVMPRLERMGIRKPFTAAVSANAA